MATEKLKQTNDQATTGQTTHQQVPPPTPQQAAIDEIKNLFQEATKQIREAPPSPTLVGEALEAARLYEVIKIALMTPTEGSPLPPGRRWNLPEQNETVKPTDQASASAG